MVDTIKPPVTFEVIRERLFAVMRERADAGDESAKQFFETKTGPDTATRAQAQPIGLRVGR